MTDESDKSMQCYVLIVEDSPDIARLLTILLDDYGWTYQVAGTLKEGILRAAQSPTPEVILLDLNLPDSSPWNTVSNLNLLMINGPVVVLSNYQDDALIEKITKQGAFYCKKEVDTIGARNIFGAMVKAIQSWRGSENNVIKDGDAVDLNFLEMKAIHSAIQPQHG